MTTDLTPDDLAAIHAGYRNAHLDGLRAAARIANPTTTDDRDKPVKCVECGITWPSHPDFLNHLTAIDRYAMTDAVELTLNATRDIEVDSLGERFSFANPAAMADRAVAALMPFIAQAKAERDAARVARARRDAALVDLRALHRESITDRTGRGMNHSICLHCEVRWPCDTAALLDRHVTDAMGEAT